MSAFGAARSATRSSAFRSAAARLSWGAKPARASPFSLPKHHRHSHRIFRSPVEMSSVVVESMSPYHTATASALLRSMLRVNRSLCCWNPEVILMSRCVASASRLVWGGTQRWTA